MYIIAELSSNYKTLDDCKEAVNLAKSVGADAIKFQYFGDMDLYGYGQEKGMSLEWLSVLSQRAKNFKIDFMCTAFSPEGYQDIDPYVKAHKVASAEATHVRILQKLRRIGKPVVLSVGATPMLEIGLAMNILQDFQLPINTYNKFNLGDYKQPDFEPLRDVTIMHCVSAYPARNPNLSRIAELKKWFPNNKIGFSDHTTDVLTIPREAQRLGAEVYEKHFTNHQEIASPDVGHSLTVAELKDMIKGLNDPSYEPLVLGELEMYTNHNRRLIATSDIPQGTKFQEGVNFGIFRSRVPESEAYSPFQVSKVDGKRALRDIQKGQGIGPRDV